VEAYQKKEQEVNEIMEQAQS